MGTRNKQRAKPRVVAGVELGHTLEQAARNAGVAPSTVAKWRKRDRRFDEQLRKAQVGYKQAAARLTQLDHNELMHQDAVAAAKQAPSEDEWEKEAIQLGEILPDEQTDRLSQLTDLAATRDSQSMRWNMREAAQEWRGLYDYQNSICENWRDSAYNRKAADEWDAMSIMSKLISDSMTEISEQQEIPSAVRRTRALVWTGYAEGLQEQADAEELPGGSVLHYKQLRAQTAAAKQLAAYWQANAAS